VCVWPRTRLLIQQQVPCSQCVARGYVCQPRCTSRRPRAPRKLSTRNLDQAASEQANTISSDGSHVPSMEQFTGYMVPNNQPQNNDMFVFNTALPQGPLDLGGYDDFMGFSYPDAHTNSDPMDTNASNNLFSSMQSMDMNTNDSQFSPHAVGSGQVPHPHYNMSHMPNQPPTPPDTTPRTTKSVPASPPGIQTPFAAKRYPQKGHIGTFYCIYCPR
jgi:hypothetical protein